MGLLRRTGSICCFNGLLVFLPDNITISVVPGIYWVMVRDDDSSMIITRHKNLVCQPGGDKPIVADSTVTGSIAFAIWHASGASVEDTWDGSHVDKYIKYDDYRNEIYDISTFKSGTVLSWKHPVGSSYKVSVFGQSEFQQNETLLVTWKAA
jgi:hypothetical protein